MFGMRGSEADSLLGLIAGIAFSRFLFSGPGVIFVLFAVAWNNHWLDLPELKGALVIPTKPDPHVELIKSPNYQPTDAYQYLIQGKALVNSPATWKQGMEGLHKSAQLVQNNPVSLASAYSSIAIGYVRKGDRDQAIRYFKSSIEISQQQAITAKSKMIREGSQASVQINRGYLRSCEFFRCRSVP